MPTTQVIHILNPREQMQRNCERGWRITLGVPLNLEAAAHFASVQSAKEKKSKLRTDK